MSTGFPDWLSPIKASADVKWHRISHLFTLDNHNFPDCENKEFKYSRRLWNPFGKSGFAHHGPNGWDFYLPEELKK